MICVCCHTNEPIKRSSQSMRLQWANEREKNDEKKPIERKRIFSAHFSYWWNYSIRSYVCDCKRALKRYGISLFFLLTEVLCLMLDYYDIFFVVVFSTFLCCECIYTTYVIWITFYFSPLSYCYASNSSYFI